jgi:predicted TPR repeat methyltransferase
MFCEEEHAMELPHFTASVRTPVGRPEAIEAIYATGHWLLAHEQTEAAARVFRVLVHAVPRDERGWLGLGECHERMGQLRIAAELYGTGGAVAEPPVRCRLARARALARAGYPDASEEALDAAEEAAQELADEALLELVASERRRSS